MRLNKLDRSARFGLLFTQKASYSLQKLRNSSIFISPFWNRLLFSKLFLHLMGSHSQINKIASLAWVWYYSACFFRKIVVTATTISIIRFANQFFRIKYNALKKNWLQKVLLVSFKLTRAIMCLNLMNRWLNWYSQWLRGFHWGYL